MKLLLIFGVVFLFSIDCRAEKQRYCENDLKTKLHEICKKIYTDVPPKSSSPSPYLTEWDTNSNANNHIDVDLVQMCCIQKCAEAEMKQFCYKIDDPGTYCRAALYKKMKEVCLSNYNRKRSIFDDDESSDGVHNVTARGAVDDCCHNPCTTRQVSLYCNV